MIVKPGLIPKSIFDGDFNGDNIGWCSLDNINRLFDLDRGTVFVPEQGSLRYIAFARRTRIELVLVPNPRKAFTEHIKDYKPNLKTFISPHAKVGKNTIIHDGTRIEHDVVIGDNCTIGGVGFGYEGGELIPHIGNVAIKAGAHIHNNVCIDRAVMGSTLIGERVKIDNLVHIAHGVTIGNDSQVIAGAVVCGSVSIGERVTIAPNVSIRQKLNIGNDSIIGLGSVVVKDVEPNTTVYGNPAKTHK